MEKLGLNVKEEKNVLQLCIIFEKIDLSLILALYRENKEDMQKTIDELLKLSPDDKKTSTDTIQINNNERYSPRKPKKEVLFSICGPGASTPPHTKIESIRVPQEPEPKDVVPKPSAPQLSEEPIVQPSASDISPLSPSPLPVLSSNPPSDPVEKVENSLASEFEQFKVKTQQEKHNILKWCVGQIEETKRKAEEKDKVIKQQQQEIEQLRQLLSEALSKKQ